jgi:uncharacterized protein YndB with AHSA1/START domain
MSDKPQFVYVTYIATTPEKVWRAIQDPELTRLYWGAAKNVSEWTAGATWEHQDYESGERKVSGRVVEAEAPRKLVLTWQQADGREPPSRVTFLIEPFMGAVKLTVVHEELEPGGATDRGIRQGWPAVLSSLKTLLESGRPLDMTTRRWSQR